MLFPAFVTISLFDCLHYSYVILRYSLFLAGFQVRTFLDSMRTRYGKLTAQRSGSSQRGMTERDRWIMNAFSFLDTHIIRHKPRSLGCQSKVQNFVFSCPLNPLHIFSMFPIALFPYLACLSPLPLSIFSPFLSFFIYWAGCNVWVRCKV